MYDHLEYKGARFYKCALQVNSFNYKQKYQGAPPINKEEYNSQILEQCKRNKIEIVGLADHGNVEDSESLFIKNFYATMILLYFQDLKLQVLKKSIFCQNIKVRTATQNLFSFQNLDS